MWSYQCASNTKRYIYACMLCPAPKCTEQPYSVCSAYRAIIHTELHVTNINIHVNCEASVKPIVNPLYQYALNTNTTLLKIKHVH